MRARGTESRHDELRPGPVPRGPIPGRVGHLLALQRSAGNRAVAGRLTTVVQRSEARAEDGSPEVDDTGEAPDWAAEEQVAESPSIEAPFKT